MTSDHGIRPMLIRAIPRRALGAEEPLIDKQVCPNNTLLTGFPGNFARFSYKGK
jgi:hypothetical protein